MIVSLLILFIVLAGIATILFGRVGTWLLRAGLIFAALIFLLSCVTSLSNIPSYLAPIAIAAPIVATKTFWSGLFWGAKLLLAKRDEDMKNDDDARKRSRERLPLPPPAANGDKPTTAPSPSPPSSSSPWVQ